MSLWSYPLRGRGLPQERLYLSLHDLSEEHRAACRNHRSHQGWNTEVPEGEPKYYVTSAAGSRGFCPNCGSRLVWQATDPEQDWTTNLCVGSLDRPTEARVTCHMYADTQLPWYKVCEDLPKFTEHDVDAVMKFIKLD